VVTAEQIVLTAFRIWLFRILVRTIKSQFVKFVATISPVHRTPSVGTWRVHLVSR